MDRVPYSPSDDPDLALVEVDDDGEPLADEYPFDKELDFNRFDSNDSLWDDDVHELDETFEE